MLRSEVDKSMLRSEVDKSMLRSEVDKSMEASARETFVAAIKSDWRKAPLAPADQALCEFAEKLSRTPGAMARGDVETLRAHGFDDRAIHDATQVVAYFNYINRVADALGTDPEDFYPARSGPAAQR